MAFQTSTEKPEPVDLSATRDEQINSLYRMIPALLKSPVFISKEVPKEDLQDSDLYNTYAKRRVLGELNQTPRIGMVVNVLKKPLAVFRDFREGKSNRQGTAIEQYFGIVSKKNGVIKFVLVTTNRNVIAKIDTSDTPEDLLRKISGLQIYKRFQNDFSRTIYRRQ